MFGSECFALCEGSTQIRFGMAVCSPFVLNGDVTGAINGVEVNVRTLIDELGMDALLVSLQLLPSDPNDGRVRETRHLP